MVVELHRNQCDIRREQYVFSVGVEGHAPIVIGTHIGGKSRSSDTIPAPHNTAPPQHARRVIGARVCTNALFVTARDECP
jgi:hypothetical protein